MTTEIFLPCYFGQQIIDASGRLSMSLFHSLWINRPRKFKIVMKTFMENAKKPLQVQSFGLVRVNLDNFKNICNATYSLFAVFKKLDGI